MRSLCVAKRRMRLEVAPAAALCGLLVALVLADTNLVFRAESSWSSDPTCELRRLATGKRPIPGAASLEVPGLLDEYGEDFREPDSDVMRQVERSFASLVNPFHDAAPWPQRPPLGPWTD